MNKKTNILLLLCLICGFAHAQFSDHFDDGNFSRDPEWTGDVYSFIVNRWQQLQLHVDAAAESYLTTPSEAAIDAQWTFDCHISCGTSAYNLIRVYLISDSENPDNGNGYYVQIGGAGKNITLARQSDGNREYLIANNDRQKILDGMQESRVHVKVQRDAKGYFTLYSLVETKDDDFVTEGSAYVERAQGKWFTVFIKNSAKNGTAFAIDNIEVTGTAQSAPPDKPQNDELHADDTVQLLHRTFTPNADGFRDQCEVAYNMPSAGYHASLSVFTASGVKVKDVIIGEPLEEQGVILWDGTTDSNAALDSGPYVLLFEAWNSDNGTKIRRKMTVALIK